jgi:hypothetical protein
MPLNLYADVDQWERRFARDIDLASADRTELEAFVEDASRDVDIHCHTHFYADTRTIELDGDGKAVLQIPDLLAATTIKLDEDGDRTFEVTLAATDYRLLRPDHRFNPYGALPKRALELDLINGSRAAFAKQSALVQIAGDWGYSNDTESTGVTVQTVGGMTAGALTFLASDGSKLSRGQTLLIGTERLYVKEVSGDTITVTRGINGSGAAGHALGDAVSRYVFPPGVVSATLIQAVRLWKRKELGFIAREEQLHQGFDPDSARRVSEFVRYDY